MYKKKKLIILGISFLVFTVFLSGCSEEINQAPIIENLNKSTSGLKITITGNFKDSDGSISTVEITWGDGSTDTISDGFDNIDKSHTYDNSGDYDIKVKATDDNGDSNNKELSVSVKANQLLTINIDKTTDNLKTKLTGSVNDSDETIKEVSIDWGDGNTTIISNGVDSIDENHTYNKSGAYKIKVKARDNSGNKSNKKFNVEVTEFAGGKGTESNPYLIETAEQLNKVRYYLDSHFKQISNINLSDYNNWEPIGNGKLGGEQNPFKGSFDGNNKEITNLVINREVDGREFNDNIGLFGYIDGGLLKNINLKIKKMTGYDNVGGLVGHSNSSKIKDSYTEGNIKGHDNVGGLIGRNYGDISNCHSKGNVTGEGDSTGGLVGSSIGTIKDSYATVNVTGGYDFEDRVGTGGLVGNNIRGDIENSYATGDVTGNDNTGGLIGYIKNGNIKDSYSTGSITGDSTGGLVGINTSGDIENSYATGDVTGNYSTGGLVGFNQKDISNSHATGNVTGKRNATGGLVGSNFGDIKDSYATGNIEGNEDVGGFVGENETTILRSYSIGKVKGDKNVGGFVGDNSAFRDTSDISEDNYTSDDIIDLAENHTIEELKDLRQKYSGGLEEISGTIEYSYYNEENTSKNDTDKGMAKTTEQMIQQDTFEPEWDFDSFWTNVIWTSDYIWTIDENSSYPYLQWQDSNIPTPPQ